LILFNGWFSLNTDLIGRSARRELRSLEGEVIDPQLDDLPAGSIQSIFEIAPYLVLYSQKAKAGETDQSAGRGDL